MSNELLDGLHLKFSTNKVYSIPNYIQPYGEAKQYWQVQQKITTLKIINFGATNSVFLTG